MYNVTMNMMLGLVARVIQKAKKATIKGLKTQINIGIEYMTSFDRAYRCTIDATIVAGLAALEAMCNKNNSCLKKWSSALHASPSPSYIFTWILFPGRYDACVIYA
jgi:hypothetical protein